MEFSRSKCKIFYFFAIKCKILNLLYCNHSTRKTTTNAASYFHQFSNLMHTTLHNAHPLFNLPYIANPGIHKNNTILDICNLLCPKLYTTKLHYEIKIHTNIYFWRRNNTIWK